MDTNYNRFCALIAASGMRGDELFRIFNRISERPLSYFVEDIEQMKMHLSDVPSGMERQSSKKIVSDSLDTVSQLQHLLIVDAELSRQTAAKLLLDLLKSRHPDRVFPQLGKNSFSSWLAALLRHVDERELLHLVSTIRNQYAHSRPDDWLK